MQQANKQLFSPAKVATWVFYALMVVQPSRGIAAVCAANAGQEKGTLATVAVIEQMLGQQNLAPIFVPWYTGSLPE